VAPWDPSSAPCSSIGVPEVWILTFTPASLLPAQGTPGLCRLQSSPGAFHVFVTLLSPPGRPLTPGRGTGCVLGLCLSHCHLYLREDPEPLGEGLAPSWETLYPWVPNHILISRRRSPSPKKWALLGRGSFIPSLWMPGGGQLQNHIQQVLLFCDFILWYYAVY
jgi:hypothetical protein